MDNPEIFMQRCLDLASHGTGQTAPNPMVGSVVVYNGRVIGEGFHHKAGEPHAEAMAIASVKERHLLPSSTLYVNLEPCSHHGKTPPCAELIIREGIKKVVVACTDPFPAVAGRGIQRLMDEGITVETGCMEQEATWLNRRFITFQTKKRPYVILKWARTRDGFIDVVRKPDAPTRPTWITDENLRMLVHKWRAEEAAIMIGTNTARMDDPRLNVRQWHGRQPVRIVADRNCSLPPGLNIFDDSQNTIVFNTLVNKTEGNTRWIKLHPNDYGLTHMLSHMYAMNIQSVLVEGGFSLLTSFIKQNLWDEARIFTGQVLFGKGCPAPVIENGIRSTVHIGQYKFEWVRNF